MKKIIFFGLGSIGQRHAKIIQKNFPFRLFAFRSAKRTRQNGLAIEEIYDWATVERIQPDIAFITNPTSLHLETALECAKRRMNLFIEKPLGTNPKQLKELLKIVSKKKLATYVAYVLRFHPVIQRMKRYLRKYPFWHMRIWTSSFLPSWRPERDPRKVYSASRKMGGGVLYDLSHEFDYTQYLLGKIRHVKAQFGRRSQLTRDAEDYADLLVETEKGPVNIHLNFMSQIPQRILQIDLEGRSVVGDLIKNTVTEYRREKQVASVTLKGSLEDCFLRQLRYFFSHIRNRRMMNNVFEAAQLLETLEALKS